MKAIRITAKKPGFRRAGLSHPDTAVDHPIDRFDKDQLKALQNEPMLVVQEVDVPEPKKSEKTDK